MAWKRRRARDAFGIRLRARMREVGATPNFMSGLMRANGYRCSQPYFSLIMNGEIVMVPEKVDFICGVLQIVGEERIRWHKAAAADYGYEMGEI